MMTHGLPAAYPKLASGRPEHWRSVLRLNWQTFLTGSPSCSVYSPTMHKSLLSWRLSLYSAEEDDFYCEGHRNSAQTEKKGPSRCFGLTLWSAHVGHLYSTGGVLVLTLQEVVQLLGVLVVVCRVAAVEGDFSCVRTDHQTWTPKKNWNQ